jgi:hypothetical protein
MLRRMATTAPSAGPADRRWRPSRVAVVLAGPALIVGLVLVILREFAFRGMVSTQQPDILPFWLPTYCLLGKSLVAAHIPSWNPFVMGGVPFAADPQSGWMYLPPLVLFTALGCAAGIRWMILAQPILAGLGVSWFCRSEGISRPGATVGGLVLASSIAGSELAVSLPFASTLAWTALLLAAASRFVHSRRWSGRLMWALATVAAWGQLVAAFASNGAALGTLALGAYAVSVAWRLVRSRQRSVRQMLFYGFVLVAAVIPVNLAYLLPRVNYLPQTSLALGYARLHELSARLSGARVTALLPGPTTGPTWPIKFAAANGAHIGAVALALVFAAWWSKERRYLAAGMSSYGALAFVVGLKAVAVRTPSSWYSAKVVQFYLHSPQRLAYGLVLAIAVLAASGVDTWREASGARARALMLAPSVLIWAILPLAYGAGPSRLALLAFGAVVGGLALSATSLRAALMPLIPVALVLELTANDLLAHSRAIIPSAFNNDWLAGNSPAWLIPLQGPFVNAEAYVASSPVQRALQSCGDGGGGPRYTSVDPLIVTRRGYLLLQSPQYWGLMANDRSMLFGVQDVQGYNPAQLIRYWLFIRSVNQKGIDYTAAAFRSEPSIQALDLLQVGCIVAPSSAPNPGFLEELSPRLLATEGRWAAYGVGAPARAQLVGSWKVVAPSTDAQLESSSLREVTGPEFDPSQQAILEADPELGPSPPSGPSGSAPGRVTYRPRGPQAARVDVVATRPSVLIVRTPFDPNWHASMDGRSVPLLHANYLIQGVAIPPGRHVVELTYDDPSIGYGLLGSALAVASMLIAAFLLRGWDRNRDGAEGGPGRWPATSSVPDAPE